MQQQKKNSSKFVETVKELLIQKTNKKREISCVITSLKVAKVTDYSKQANILLILIIDQCY